ncbi:MAG: metallophosphoesterase [Dysgonamonadaceae bacterium]|jgi:predicted MPP superfamily phosphohydrolase|nr:metallophosphoesterase [Dysgonamonadaceae bacterium]
MKFFILVFVIFTAVNAYLFGGGWRALSKRKSIRLGYGFAFFVVYSSFIIAMLGRNVLPLGIQKILYSIGTVWMGFMLYLTIWLLLSDLILLFFKKQVRKSLRIWQMSIGYGLVIITLAIGYYRFTHPQIVEQKITIAKSNEKYKSLKVAAISDLHLGVANDKKRLQQYVQLINNQRPDMIWIAGDVVDNNALPLERERMYEELNQLQSPLGTYMCLGNHEYLSGIDASLDFLSKTNIYLLIDQAVQIDSCFCLIGRNDSQHSLSRLKLNDLTEDLDKTQALFLLDHEPYHLEEAQAAGIDLQFSGHTHEGQMWPLNLLTHAMFENSYGYLQKDGTQYYVSSGLGLWGPPFRIGTRSEVVIFDIRFNK